MSTAQRLVRTRDALALAAILAVCMAMGSIFDLELSRAVFDLENPFGVVLAAYGQVPAAACCALAGTLLIVTFDRARPASSAALGAIGIALVAGALVVTTIWPRSYLDLALPVRALIAGALIAGVDAVALHVLRGADQARLRRYAAYLIAVVALDAIIVDVLKIIWARPRMRMLAVTAGAEFQPWWVIGSGQREALEAAGVAAEEFKSFPSGHTASATCAMALALALPAVKPSLARRRAALFWGSAAVPAAVAASRIIMGAHFLTDVAAGYAICFAITVLALGVFYRGRLPAPDAQDTPDTAPTTPAPRACVRTTRRPRLPRPPRGRSCAPDRPR